MGYSDPDGGAGVGGWLAFLVLTLALFTPLGLVIGMARDLYGPLDLAAAYGAMWPTLQAFEWAVVAAQVAGSWYLAWRLNYVQVWQTVRITIAGLWLLAIGGLLVETLGVILIANVPVAAAAEGLGAAILRPAIVCALWTAYLLRSRRVANTYPVSVDADEAQSVFG